MTQESVGQDTLTGDAAMQNQVAQNAKNEPKDIKPAVERKDGDNTAAQLDADKIGSPDVFLTDYHRDPQFDRVRVYQIYEDGKTRGYITVDSTQASGSRVGYAELSEGMDKQAAEEALRRSYDNVAVVV